MDIEDWRKKIDELDQQIVALISERASAAQAIGRLLNDPGGRESMARAARELVVQRYSFAQIGRELCDVFESAAACRPLPNAGR